MAFVAGGVDAVGLRARRQLAICGGGKVQSGPLAYRRRRPTTPKYAPVQCSVMDRLFNFASRALSPKSAGERRSSAERSRTATTEPDVARKQPAAKQRKSVMVVGATGRLGTLIVAELQRRGYDVIASVRDSSKSGAKLRGVQTVVGEFSDENMQSIADRIAASGADAVIWAAGPSGGFGGESGSAPSTPQLITNALIALVRQLQQRGFASGSTRSVLDFSDEATSRLFERKDDVVMGGVSESAVHTVSDGAHTHAIFEGEVSLRNRGGFCAARADLARGAADDGGEESGRPLDLSGYEGLLVRARGDGKRYKLNLNNYGDSEMVFQAEFTTDAAPEDAELEEELWHTYRLPFSSFLPVRRGKLQYGEGESIYAAKLDPSCIVSIGVVQSKLGVGGVDMTFTPGKFHLRLREILAYRSTTPKFVLTSAAAVTRRLWEESTRQQYRASYSIPIVGLNPMNLLGEKLRAEDALRASGFPYAIIRNTSLNDSHPSGEIVATQGDTLSGRINRADSARLVVEALGNEQATYKTFEVTVNASAAPREHLGDLFTPLRFDAQPVQSVPPAPKP